MWGLLDKKRQVKTRKRHKQPSNRSNRQNVTVTQQEITHYLKKVIV